MTEADRALAMAALSTRLVDWLSGVTAMMRLPDEDADGIVLAALIGAAAAVAAGRCVDAAANVALIHCVAESVVADIYGGAP